MAPEIEAILQKSMDFIEENLRAEITVQELCADAGYSLYHYCRLFESATGISVKRYITRRKLLHAAYDMQQGMDAIEAALAYGFQTHAGFYKAFRREFGCAPSAYLRTHFSLKPSRICLKEEATMLGSKQITAALAQWGMERESIGNVHYRNTGNRSQNTCTVGKKHYLKYSASLGDLQRTAKLQNALKHHGLAASIVPARDGSDIVTKNGVDFMLMERIEGETLSAAEMIRNPSSAKWIGEGLARLHDALRTCDSVLCQEEDLMATLRGWAIPKASETMQIDRAFLDGFLTRMEAAYPRLPKQIIHRDPNPDNILVRDERVVCFLDFNLSKILPRIFDLAYVCTAILSTTYPTLDEAERSRFFDMSREIWSGYHQHTPLNETEQRLLPDLLIAIQLICVAAFSSTQKYAALAKTNQDMLNFLIQNK